MSGVLKSERTVALDDVSRLAARIITIYDDLSGLAEDPDTARELARQADRRAEALKRFNDARAREGHVAETTDPERAHLQALWLKLRSAVSGASAMDELAALLRDLDSELERHRATARGFHLGEPLAQALDELVPGAQ